MHEIDIDQCRKDIVVIIEANRDKIISFEAADDYSIFTFNGQNYSCEISLSNEWIGYDLGIEIPDDVNKFRLGGDNDGLSIEEGANEQLGSKLYQDLLMTVNAIFNSHIYYSATDKHTCIAIKNEEGTYDI